jgi:hypothetical protein
MADPTIDEQPQALQTIDPSTGFQPQQLPSPQPDAPAPQTGNVNPDAFPSQPAQVGGPAPTVEQAPQPFWKTLLRGALAGLAGSAGAHNWGQALGQGVGGEMKQRQQDFQNQQQQQAQASQIRFRDAQDAYNTATLTQNQQRLDLLTAADRDRAQQAADKHAQMLTSLGATVTPVPVGSAGSGPATAFLTQASTHPDGAAVSGWSVPGPDTMYAVSFDGENGPQAQYQVYSKAAKAFGLPVFDKTMVLGLPRQKQMTTEQLPQQFLLGSDEQGKPYGKGEEAQLRAAIAAAQSKVKDLSGQPEDSRDDQALTLWQTRLSHLNTSMAAINQTNDAQTDRQVKVAGARGVANNMSRVVDAVDDTGTLRPMTNAERLKTGAVAAAPAMKAGSAQAQVNDIVTGSQAARKAVENVTPLSIAQVGELSQVMNHDSDPTVRHDMLNAFLNKNSLTEPQKDFVVALNQLNERALSLRNVAGMGQASDQMRSAIRATLPSAASGDKSLMLKQLDAFDQQVQQLRGGMAKVPGLAGAHSSTAVPQRPAGVPANAQWDAGTRTWHL